MTDITPLPWTWHPQSKDQAHTGSVYCLRRPGHAYAVAMQPRYQTDESWNADAAYIVLAANHRHKLVEALEFIRDGYERTDINHVDYRVGAYKAALDALAAHKETSL